tara:strand:- start:330 stop:623 length:294 start_codon:yes stop_codon:yes gene_type:complete
MKEIDKKVFVSSNADKGVLIKFSKGKNRVSLSFWGDDKPSNISFTAEEALEMCEYIKQNIIKKPEAEKDIFQNTFENMKKMLPEPEYVKHTESRGAG